MARPKKAPCRSQLVFKINGDVAFTQKFEGTEPVYYDDVISKADPITLALIRAIPYQEGSEMTPYNENGWKGQIRKVTAHGMEFKVLFRYSGWEATKEE